MAAVFVTVSSPDAALMVRSLREFGGSLKDSPVWVFGSGKPIAGTEAFTAQVPKTLEDFDLADKVVACAAAEEMAAGKYQTMVWISPDCLVLNPPVLYLLEGEEAAALRPVHVKNIGLAARESPNRFWEAVYRASGRSEMNVRTFLGDEEIHAYYNTHAFSVDPDLGLMGDWARIFTGLAQDGGTCPDMLHRTFLHQAVFSALMSSRLGQERIRMLPSEYNYPYNLQSSIPEERRAVSLAGLVTVARERKSMNPDDMHDIGVPGWLGQWLAENV